MKYLKFAINQVRPIPVFVETYFPDHHTESVHVAFERGPRTEPTEALGAQTLRRHPRYTALCIAGAHRRRVIVAGEILAIVPLAQSSWRDSEGDVAVVAIDVVYHRRDAEIREARAAFVVDENVCLSNVVLSELFVV